MICSLRCIMNLTLKKEELGIEMSVLRSANPPFITHNKRRQCCRTTD